ncbi:hypothetical protein FACS1894142_5930 [Spirochaetia bacterium]|nr:hypothetical protein FACS1894142_5930 [Spirochaetia bacterium]GHU58392.1 hypothetical protein FACS189444_1970 [Spirochaetia bacterium]GHV09528.1 hypothetical protein FACS189485_22210 [Spirochaetia bacterium]
MYERMLNKQIVPTEDEIREYIGEKSIENMNSIINAIGKIFKINIELKFPYGNNYGWGYRIGNEKNKFLFNIFFERGSINVMLRTEIKTEKEIEKHNELTEEGKEYWKNRYPCGNEGGGWIHYRVKNKKNLKDIGIFLSIKTKKEIVL